ncbi:MAG: metallophosphoesterase [Pseudomonadota bacterium]
MLRARITRRALLGAGVAAAGYAGAVEPGFRLRVQHWQVSPPLWPRGQRLRIVALADPHLCEPHMPLSRFRRIIARANGLGGDLIVLLGDYLAGHDLVTGLVPVAEIAAAMSELEAPLGVYAILGNHDWWGDAAAQARGAGPTALHAALAEAGVTLLENDALKLSYRGLGFWLAGIGDPIAFLTRSPRPAKRGVDNFDRMMDQITDEAPAILLLHEPDFWPRWRDRFALSLAGHTHGGQVRLLGWSPVVPSSFGQRFAYGPVLEEDRLMVVSGGLGCSILPVRFGMPPEITVVEVA